MTRLDKIFDIINRRSSDVSTESPSVLLNSFEGHRSLRNRAKSMSLVSNGSSTSTLSLPTNEGKRNRSKSVGKKHTKGLIIQETKQVVQKKLSTLLQELGLQEPVPAKYNNSNSSSLSRQISVYVANSNNCIYLAPASSASFTYEDVENGVPNVNQDIDSDAETSSNFSLNQEDNITDDSVPSHLRETINNVKSPNYLCSKIDSDTPIPHTFGVIIELHKDTPLHLVKFEFSSTTNILWPSGDPYNKSHTRDNFKIGKLDWVKSLSNADYYINSLNSSDFKAKTIDTEVLAKRTRYYKLKKQQFGKRGQYNSTNDSLEQDIDESEFYDDLQDNQAIYKAGIYIFVLPILIPEHIPPTITSISGSLNHVLSVVMQRSSEKLNRKLSMTASYNLPMVRTPPSSIHSFTDKPIYVNRVWNDSLHYIITFPRKYVALGSEYTINVKVVPLVKDVIIKRIKFNVLERLTYVSQDLSREFDYDGEDPFYLKPLIGDNKTRERVVSVCELKTKNKPSTGINEPYKEEVIKCPDNNLLYSCYEAQTPDTHFDDIENFKIEDPMQKDQQQQQQHHQHHHHLPIELVRSKKRANSNVDPQTKEKEYMVASPLDINIALPFLTTKNDKLIQASNDETKLKKLDSSSAPNSRKASIMSTDSINSGTPSSPIIGALETNLVHSHNELLTNEDEIDFLTPDSSALMHQFSHNNMKENIQHGYTTVGRALYPDSNFRHIQIRHRLQVCFRISKPDPSDNNKMHHYEVVVDTPLILLSSKCNDESIQLPKYDEVNLSENKVANDGILPQSSNQSSNGISFRTPNFDKNHVGYHQVNDKGEVFGQGISIKPWDGEETDDSLPSFKEAISSIPSPATRTISISEDPLSRVPSISIDSADIPMADDPPAYDGGNTIYTGPLNIDAVVNNMSTEGPQALRSSRVRSSLVNSFAPIGLSNTTPSTISDGLCVSPTNTSSNPMLNMNDCRSGNSSSNSSGSVSKEDEGSFLSLDSPPDIGDSGSMMSLESSNNLVSNQNIESSSCVFTSEDSSNILSNRNDINQEVSGSSESISNAQSSVSIPMEGLSIDQTEDIDELEFSNNEENKEMLQNNEVEERNLVQVGEYNNGLEESKDFEKDKEFEDKEDPKFDPERENKAFEANELYKNNKTENLDVDKDVVPDLDPAVASNRRVQDLVDKEKKMFNLSNDSEGNMSIITHDSVYEQRLPLLRHMSSETSVPLVKQNTTSSQNKISTDNLSVITESNQGHEIYHAY